MAFKKIAVIAIAIISIAIVTILFNNFEIQTTIENKKTFEEKPTDKLATITIQNNNIPTNIQTNISKSKYVTVYSLVNGTGPNGILVDKDGMIWTSGSSLHSLFRLDPRDNTLRSYAIPVERHGSTMVWTMVQDNDGALWFSQFGGNPLWMFDPKTEKFSLFHPSAPPFQMKLDEKTGNIWFTTLVGNTLGVIQKVENENKSTQYKITEFPLGKETDPSGLFFKDDTVWVAELLKSKVVTFDIVSDDNGLVTAVVKKLEMPQSEKIWFASPTDVLVPNDKKIWVTEHVPSTITEYDIKSDTAKRFPTARSGEQVSTLPFWMRESLDHKGIWFNEHQGNRIGFFNTTDHTLVEFNIPNNQAPELSPYMLNNPVARQNILDQNAYYSAIFTLNLSLDPQDPNRLWFSQWNNDKIGVVDRSKPVSFDIHSDVTRVVLSGNDSAQQKATISIDVTKNHYISEDNRNVVFLTASSTMVPNGEFTKVAANFTNNTIDFTKQNLPVQLVLQNEGAKPGNYTIGISASDGLVTKTIFVDLNILQ